MLNKYTIQVFSANLNQIFQINFSDDDGKTSGKHLQVELIDVMPLRVQEGQKEDRVPFSVVFRGPHEPLLPQKIYTVEHEELGRLDLFLVPIGSDKGATLYEAIFN